VRRGCSKAQPGSAELRRVVEHIVSTTPPSRLFELYYWAQEPQLLTIIRQLAALPPANRAAIESFFDLAAGDASITATCGPNGQLILAAKHLGQAACILHYMLDDEEPIADDGKPN
jgi:hypothetical protein